MSSKFIIIILFFLSLFIPEKIFSSGLPYRFGLSLNYPGVGFRYIFKKNLLELRWQKSEDESYVANFFGLRYFRYLHEKIFYYYVGLETGVCDTKKKYSDISSGGFVAGGFIGIEKFLYKKFSLNLDLGPYISTGNVENITVSEFDFVLNISLNFYLK